ncbi:MAG: transporter [Magnetococcus sp. YQC-5]
MRIIYAILSILFVFLQSATGLADNDPLDYTQYPAGTNAFVLYYEHAWGHDMYANGRRTATDYAYKLNVIAAKLATYRELGGRLYIFEVGVPFVAADLEQASTGLNLGASSVGDPLFLAAFWPYTNKEAGVQWGVSGWVTLPLGEYDRNKPMNIGNNRWVFKPETNLTFTPVPGLALEATAAVEMFTDNDSFTAANRTLSRDPLLTLEGHISKQVTSELNLSLDYFFHGGGETFVDEVGRNDAREDHALQTTVAFPLGQDYFLRLLYRNDFDVENGPQSQTVGLRLSKPF